MKWQYENLMECKFCLNFSSEATNLNTHLVLCQSEKAIQKFECTSCGKRYIRKCDLNSHENLIWKGIMRRTS